MVTVKKGTFFFTILLSSLFFLIIPNAPAVNRSLKTLLRYRISVKKAKSRFFFSFSSFSFLLSANTLTAKINKRHQPILKVNKLFVVINTLKDIK